MTLRLENLCFSYDDKAILHNISFDVEHGSFAILAGASGCGKSTLLSLIAGFEIPDSGSIFINNNVVANKEVMTPPNKRDIGIMFQQPSLFPHLTVKQNIAFGIKHYTSDQKNERINMLLERIGLAEHAHKYPHMLSGGQHQRVALARAVAPSPKILLLDEPYANLDDGLRRALRDEMRSFLSSEAITTIMVTHSPDEAMLLADMMYLLNTKGEINQYGSPSELYQQPINIDVAEFFGSINKLEGCIKGNVIETELGNLPIKGNSEYQNCLIAVRPNGIQLSHDSGATKVLINKIIYSAQGWDIFALTSSDTPLHITYYGMHDYKVGDYISVSLSGNDYFLFLK